MEVATVLLALAHVLVLVYWLGGDLGAFYASSILTDAKQPAPARIAAAQVLSNVDMAPRTAMILAAPTGVHLASAKGWLTLEPIALVTIWVVFLAWLALAWRIHLSHAAPNTWLRTADLIIRWLMIAGLLIAATGYLAPLPAFITIKCVLLSATIGLGLAIRATLTPFGPAFASLARGAPNDETNATIANCLARARPLVIAIWLCLVMAAALGLATPVNTAFLS
jgi:hypothetical protein